jgi:hypothetical protein
MTSPLCRHLSAVTVPHVLTLFTEKLSEATTGRFQITTDGFTAYPVAIERTFGIGIDHAQLVKVYRAFPRR